MRADGIPESCRFTCTPAREYLVIPENQGDATSRLVQCERCALVYESPRPSRDAIDAFYANATLWTQSTDAEGNLRSYVKELEAKRPIFDDLVRRIERYKQGGTVLDVGSGAGLLQRSMDPAQWQVLGIEMSAFIAEYGRRELGMNVIPGTFEAADVATGAYDVVVMKYVLDHMETPVEALRKARDVLRPDGLLVLADLININSFCARVFAEGHRLFHPMHFTYFSSRTITAHLCRLGFRVIRIEYPFFQTPYFTAANTLTLARRVARRLWVRLSGRNERVFSVAWRGSLMDVWAVPADPDE